MTAVTFGALKTRIQNEVNRPSTANLSYIGDAIITAIRFFEAKPVWFTEVKDYTLTLTSGTNYVTLPTNFKRAINLRISVNGYLRGQKDGFKPTTIQTLEDTWTQADLTQTPIEWALSNNKIYFNCIADQDYTLYLTYNCGDTTYPSVDGDTSVWLDDGMDTIRYKATAIFLRDRLHAYDLAGAADAQANIFLDNLNSRHNTRKYSNRLA